MPRLAAPKSSASPDTSANTHSAIPVRVASHTVRRVGRCSAAHRFDDDMTWALLQNVGRNRTQTRLGEAEVDQLRVAPLCLVDNGRADAAGADDRRPDLEL